MSILDEERLTFAAAGQLLNKNAATIWRWALKPNRFKLRLRSVLLGGIRVTTRQWLEDYIAATTAAANGEAPPEPSPKHRERIAAARRELADR
jgi:hypothetical protein